MTTRPSAARWIGNTQPERFEVMTRWSIYFVFALLPALALALITGGTDDNGAWPLLYLVLVTVHAVLAARVFVPAMRVYSKHGPWPVTRMRWLAVSTVLTVVVAVVGYPGPSDVLGFAMLLPLAGVVMAVSPIPARLWTLVALSLASGVITALVQLALDSPLAALVPTLIISVFSVTAVALSARMTVWMMDVVWELDDARETAGRLAVAEERLRFSRDLHDVFGRTLSTVAVKSELAAALAVRGDPRGAAEMLEVRQLAHDALREVRSVIQGYRSADLATEIAGARELLRSAGVECRVAGEGVALPGPVAEAVAWVVREAVTNVVRHSEATSCEIDVRLAGPVCRVQIGNDGVPADIDTTGGSGLRGVSERLGARGGSLTVSRDDGRFLVEGRVPMDLEGETGR